MNFPVFVELDSPQQINTKKKQKEIEAHIINGVAQRDIALLCHYVSGTDYKEELEKLRTLCNQYCMKHRPYTGQFLTP
jgi:hypothetical protein